MNLFPSSIKNRGIIGLIRVVDNMVWTTETRNVANESQASELDRSYNTIDELPTAALKSAANYIGTKKNLLFLIFTKRNH